MSTWGWQPALIFLIVGIVLVGAVLAKVETWHRKTYVRRFRPGHPVCSPAVSRAWIKHWQSRG